MRTAVYALLALVFLLRSSVEGAEFFDDFNGPKLDGQNWCTCQIDMKRLPVVISPQSENPSNGVAQITIDDKLIGDRDCKPPCGVPRLLSYMWHILQFESPESPDRLGPSLLSAAPKWQPEPVRQNPYCDAADCIQRQELRPVGIVQELDIPQDYSIRFRMPATVKDEKNSIRWVTSQWKAEPVNEKYTESASPFLAQRFDDGVLHVTMQDENCRCLIASAPLVSGDNYTWNNGNTRYCQSTLLADSAGKECASRMSVTYGDDPVLTPPKARWTEMRYRIQTKDGRPTAVEIYQDARFIVRVTGAFGYEPPSDAKQKVKFKIGQYRDFMPSTDIMEVDWVKIRSANQ